MANCKFHPTVEAVTTCADCGAGMCKECDEKAFFRLENGHPLCRECSLEEATENVEFGKRWLKKTKRKLIFSSIFILFGLFIIIASVNAEATNAIFGILFWIIAGFIQTRGQEKDKGSIKSIMWENSEKGEITFGKVIFYTLAAPIMLIINFIRYFKMKKSHQLDIQKYNEILNAVSEYTAYTEEKVPIFDAIEHNDKAEVLRLIENGADINKELYMTYDNISISLIPLTFAMIQENMDIVSLLIEKGANINYIDNLGRTPLLVGCIANATSMVSLLVEKGSDVNYENAKYGTPLFQAIEKENMEVISMLVKKGADVNKITSEILEHDEEKPISVNFCPLMCGIISGNKDIVSFLIENGADVNLNFSPDESLLDIAVDKGNSQIISLLKEHGAK